MRADRTFGHRCASAKATSPGRVDLRTTFKRLQKDRFLSLLACLILLAPMSMHGQSASDVAQSRLSCAQGLGQQALERVRAMGARMGLGEMCVKALNWTAKNGDLLDIYSSGTDRNGARLLVNRIDDSAKASTVAFRSDGSPADMWNKGELTPSLAFDAAFTRSFLDKPGPPPASMSTAELQRRTEGCLSDTQSLAVCADTGRIQAALAYQMVNAFSDSSDTGSAQPESQGPDKAQVAAAIDQKFQNWGQSWSFDRYQPGSVQVTGITCSGQCKVSGQFSFTRFVSVHTIPFVAFLSSTGNGQFSLGRVCYNDETTNMQDCTN